MTSAFKCDICGEIKVGDAAAFGREIPNKAFIKVPRGENVWDFRIFVHRSGPINSTVINPAYEDLHVCHPCTRELLMQGLEES